MYINKFESWLKQKGRSNSTIRAYRNILYGVSRWYQEQTGKSFNPQKVTTSQLQKYINYIESIQKPATVHQKLVALKTYWKFLNEQGLVTTNPIRSVSMKQPIQITKSYRWLTEDEISDLYDQIEKTRNERHRKRNRAIVSIMLRAGLRISEVSDLRMDDMEAGEGIMKIHTGEGEQRRIIHLDQSVINELNNWITMRGEVSMPFVFVSQKKKQMDPRSIRYVLDSCFKKSGIEGASPSSLRHTCARNMVQKGESYGSIASYLGLENKLGVMRYCRELAK